MGDSTISPTSTINPLVSRLDRLDFLMKYLERRTKFEGNNNNINNNNNNIMDATSGGAMERPKGFVLPMPMELALKEVESKGSLVDRVAALESRLFQVKRAIQISLDMDQSSGTSQTSSSGICSQSEDGTLSLRSGGELSNGSLPTFNYYPTYNGNTKISQVHVMTTTHEIEENSDVETQNLVPSDPPNKKKSKKNNKEEKKDKQSHKGGKKRTLPNWTHLRLLGC